MTCRRVPWVHPTCPCGRPLQLGVDHGDDELGNPLCPTCSGCGCEPEERKTMNDSRAVPGEQPAPRCVDMTARGDTVKMIRETLCVAQCDVGNYRAKSDRRNEHVARLGRLLDICDEHRPLGPDGSHGDLHTTTCGCIDGQLSAAPSPDEDTRREVAELIELLRGGWWDDTECEHVCGLLAAAYLRGTDGR